MGGIEELKRRIEDAKTDALFPAIYDGCAETDAVAQGENSMLNALSLAIRTLFENCNLHTLSLKMIEVFEEHFGIIGAETKSLEARRAEIIRIINHSSQFNEAELAEYIRLLPGGENIGVLVNPKTLILSIFEYVNSEDPIEGEIITNIVKQIRPIIPQNIYISPEVRATQSLGVYASYGWTGQLHSSLGLAVHSQEVKAEILKTVYAPHGWSNHLHTNVGEPEFVPVPSTVETWFLSSGGQATPVYAGGNFALYKNGVYIDMLDRIDCVVDLVAVYKSDGTEIQFSKSMISLTTYSYNGYETLAPSIYWGDGAETLLKIDVDVKTGAFALYPSRFYSSPFQKDDVFIQKGTTFNCYSSGEGVLELPATHTYSIKGLYKKDGTEIPLDGFSLHHASASRLAITYIRNDSEQDFYIWRALIGVDDVPADAKKAFGRSAAYQTANTTTAAGGSTVLYDEGESGSKNEDPSKRYRLIGVYDGANNALRLTDLSLFRLSGKLRLMNKSSASVIWRYLLYTEL